LISVSDILKILDQVPIWKTVKELPKRVEALEKANAELEAKLKLIGAAPPKAHGQICPACGEPAVRRKSSQPHKGHFADMGVRDEIWTCEICGDSETRMVTS